MCTTLDVFISTTATTRYRAQSVAALCGSSKAARERALLPFTKSVWSDVASSYRMCGISGVKGLNLYTVPLNKLWVYLCLV